MFLISNFMITHENLCRTILFKKKTSGYPYLKKGKMMVYFYEIYSF